ncbi:hypothetical protein G4B88_026297 [Cannabis sativa]|uniref:Uncharacterized protein n=1 Tax=Cannabis sativa TaxID=3483 RepID=A0A7J6FXB0_CANSA|nr:hypothetical protein G4B88_026297 [Cannabis sativa]
MYATLLAVMKFVITTKSVEKSMEQYSAVPYLATLINCLVWTLYGLLFIHPGNKKKMIKVVLVLAELVFISILTLLTLTLSHSHNKRSIIKSVITTKSVEFMPFFLSFASLLNAMPYLATLINCLVWTLYGFPFIHPGSILVVTINESGVVIELSYLIIFFIF